jgi:hypothetical protein
MSFEETDDAFIWQCDNCQLQVEFPSLDFYRSVAELKNRNWQFTREREGGWTHLCSRCRPKRTNVAEFLARKATA